MNRPKQITSKTLATLKKECENVDALKRIIQQYQDKLHNIEQENKWLNYLGEHSLDNLTDDEKAQLFQMHETLNYATRI